MNTNTGSVPESIEECCIAWNTKLKSVNAYYMAVKNVAPGELNVCTRILQEKFDKNPLNEKYIAQMSLKLDECGEILHKNISQLLKFTNHLNNLNHALIAKRRKLQLYSAASEKSHQYPKQPSESAPNSVSIVEESNGPATIHSSNASEVSNEASLEKVQQQQQPLNLSNAGFEDDAEDLLNETKVIATAMKYALGYHKITHQTFASTILGVAQGTCSEILRAPKPWGQQTPRGTATLNTMREWLLHPTNIVVMRNGDAHFPIKRGLGGTDLTFAELKNNFTEIDKRVRTGSNRKLNGEHNLDFKRTPNGNVSDHHPNVKKGPGRPPKKKTLFTEDHLEAYDNRVDSSTPSLTGRSGATPKPNNLENCLSKNNVGDHPHLPLIPDHRHHRFDSNFVSSTTEAGIDKRILNILDQAKEEMAQQSTENNSFEDLGNSELNQRQRASSYVSHVIKEVSKCLENELMEQQKHTRIKPELIAPASPMIDLPPPIFPTYEDDDTPQDLSLPSTKKRKLMSQSST